MIKNFSNRRFVDSSSTGYTANLSDLLYAISPWRSLQNQRGGTLQSQQERGKSIFPRWTYIENGNFRSLLWMETRIIMVTAMEVEVSLNQCCINLLKSISVDQYFAIFFIKSIIQSRILLLQYSNWLKSSAKSWNIHLTNYSICPSETFGEGRGGVPARLTTVLSTVFCVFAPYILYRSFADTRSTPSTRQAFFKDNEEYNTCAIQFVLYVYQYLMLIPIRLRDLLFVKQ